MSHSVTLCFSDNFTIAIRVFRVGKRLQLLASLQLCRLRFDSLSEQHFYGQGIDARENHVKITKFKRVLVTRLSFENLVNRELRCKSGTVLAAVTAQESTVSNLPLPNSARRQVFLSQESEDLPVHFES